MKNWTKEEIQVLKDNIQKLSYREIGAMIGKSKGAVSQFVCQHKDEEELVNGEIVKPFVRSEKAQKRIIIRTNTTVFKPGQKPWNTGTKGLVKPNKTSFTSGNSANIAYPEFSISYKENKNGKKYKVIKIGNGWVRLHRYNWEQLFGPIPDGYVIWFKDGDSLNCDPQNLECIDKAEQRRRLMSYKIKMAAQRRALEDLAKSKPKQKPLYFKPQPKVEKISEIPVKINDKTTIYVKPGADIEAIKQKYSHLN